MRRPRRVRACALGLLLGGLGALVGCGDAPAPAPAPPSGAWAHARLKAVGPPAAAAVHEGLLLVLPAGERSLYAVERASLAADAGERPRLVPLEVARGNPLEGHGSGDRGSGLAGQGHTLGVLWEQPLEFVGLAVRRVRARGAGADLEALYVLERTYGVVFWGRLLRDANGRLVAGQLDAAFVVPERPRAGAERLDWRDSGPGLAALALLGGPTKNDDLVALDALAPGSATSRLHLLDRFGQRLGAWPVELAGEPRPEVRALAPSGAEHLLLLGPGRGELRRLPATGAAVRVAATGAEATPVVQGVSAWRALASADDALYLLGADGAGCTVAWRKVVPSPR